MNLLIRPITSKNQDDFLSLFSNDNFSHDSSWKKCYCISYHTTYTPEEWHRLTDEDNILEARKKITSGVIKGLLAYDDNKCVGWVNVNNTLSYTRILDNLDDQFKDGNTAMAICFLVEKEHRGKQIASALLEAAILYCQDFGYKKLISLVNRDNHKVSNFRCAANMYLDRGFEEYTDSLGNYYVVKKLERLL
jgi:GNAT superfamily N-acetyltransferase